MIEEVISQLAKTRAMKFGPAEQAGMHNAETELATNGLQGSGSNGHGNGSLSDGEARHIEELLNQRAGNRRKVAAELGISECTLYRKPKKYNLT